MNANDVISLARSKIGVGENPVDHNEFTAWYGMDAAWCAMFVSWCLTKAGLTYRYAYVPYMVRNAKLDGFQLLPPSEAQPGDIAIYKWTYETQHEYSHTGWIVGRQGGTLECIDGNYGNRVTNYFRPVSDPQLRWVLRPPYDGSVTPPPAAVPPWPGRYLTFGVTGDDVRLWQQRMADRGWTIAVDGDYGPQSAGVARAFQAEKGLAVDGIVGPQTWAAAWTAPVT